MTAEEKIDNIKLYASALDFEEGVFISCECGNPEHAMQVTYYDDDVDEHDPDDLDKCPPFPELNFNLQLSPYLGFWRRILVGIKYIFGFTHKRGHWNCCMVDEENARMIIKCCETYLADVKKAKEMYGGVKSKDRKIY